MKPKTGFGSFNCSEFVTHVAHINELLLFIEDRVQNPIYTLCANDRILLLENVLIKNLMQTIIAYLHTCAVYACIANKIKTMCMYNLYTYTTPFSMKNNVHVIDITDKCDETCVIHQTKHIFTQHIQHLNNNNTSVFVLMRIIVKSIVQLHNENAIASYLYWFSMRE